MKLDNVVQSEVSQKGKIKYLTLMTIYGIQKNGTDEPTCRVGTEMQTEKGHVNTGVEGEGRMN